jgi:hypothetical protein
MDVITIIVRAGGDLVSRAKTAVYYHILVGVIVVNSLMYIWMLLLL